MKALVLRGPNNLHLEERPIPVPGANEVLIKVAAASICHTDFVTIDGQFEGMEYPKVLGHEFSGTVQAVGPGVVGFRCGDRVTAMSYVYCGLCPACRRGDHTACNNILAMPFSMDGAFQEYLIAHSLMVFPIKDSLSFEHAALCEPAGNAYAAADRADIRLGDNVVIMGPGPIGLIALQVAALKYPASLIMLGTRAERLRVAAGFGATATVNVKETDAYQAVMDLTGGLGADVVLFCGGSEDAWEFAGRILALHGRVAIEALPASSSAQWPVPVMDFTAKQISYLGVRGYSGAQFGAALHLMEAGKIDVGPLITHSFALDDYQEAFRTVEERKGGALKVLFRM